MLKGDLATTPLPDVLRSTTEGEPTGCLHIVRGDGEEALVYVKGGLVYSAYVPGRRPQLGARLVSSGAIAPEALEEALEAQATELQGWRLGELLVHLGYVERPVVEAFVVEQLRESIYDLTQWTEGRWRFRKGEKTREDVGGSTSVEDLLAEAERRGREWLVLNESVHGPHAVPVLSAGGLGSAEMTLDQDQWALLCKVDGERSIAELARDCGFTVFEAGQVVHQLVTAGLLEVEESVDDEPAPPPTGAPGSARLASAIASLLSGDPATDDPAEGAEPADAEEPVGEPEEEVVSLDDDTPTMARLSSALLVPITSDDAAGEIDSYADSLDADDDAGIDNGSELSRLLGGYSAPDEDAPLEDAPVDDEPPGEAEAAEAAAAANAAAGFDLPDLMVPELAPPPRADQPTASPAPAEAAPASGRRRDSFSESLAKVSEALSTLLGDSGSGSGEVLPALLESDQEEEAALAERIRAANAAELQAMQAEEEATRRQQKQGGRRGRKAEQRADEEAARSRADASRADAPGASQADDEAAAEQAARADVEAAVAFAAEQARIDAEAAEAAAADEQARAEAEVAAAAAAEQARIEAAAAEAAAEQERAEIEAAEAAAAELARQEAEFAAAELIRIEAEAARALAAEQAQLDAYAAEDAELRRREAAEAEAEQARQDAEAEQAREDAEAARHDADADADLAESDADDADTLAALAELAAAAGTSDDEDDPSDLLSELGAFAESGVGDDESRPALTVLDGGTDSMSELAAYELVDHADPAAAANGAAPDETSDAAAMLREIAADSPPPATPPGDDLLADVDGELVVDGPEPDETPPALPRPVHTRDGNTDTASLLRELSSLGLDDESTTTRAANAAAVKRPPSQQPTPSKTEPKKRKGLFGRG